MTSMATREQQQQQQQAGSAASSINNQSATLYPPLESTIASLDESETILDIVNEDKNLQTCLRQSLDAPLSDLADVSYLPEELFADSGKKKPTARLKMDPLKKLKKLETTDEVVEEEELEDEEGEDEEEKVEDEEEDAGGDYLVSHFDNGENFEDNDEEGDDMTSVI